MNESNALEEKIKSLQRNQRVQFLLIFALIAVVGFQYYQPADQQAGDIIRAKGIVIEDARGNERILIGAPVPFASNRVRTDSNKVWNYWGQYYEPEFMDWYQDYNHNNYGILILDSIGFDRIAIGNPIPDLSFGQRIGPLTGIAINDSLGNERTGYGVLTVNGKDRVNLGLDNSDGTEGATLALDEYGIAGLNVHTRDHSIFLGKTDSINPYLNSQEPFNGLIFKKKNGSKKVISIDQN